MKISENDFFLFSIEPKDWPEMDSLKVFHTYFDVKYSSWVFDLSDEDLEKEF